MSLTGHTSSSSEGEIFHHSHLLFASTWESSLAAARNAGSVKNECECNRSAATKKLWTPAKPKGTMCRPSGSTFTRPSSKFSSRTTSLPAPVWLPTASCAEDSAIKQQESRELSLRSGRKFTFGGKATTYWGKRQNNFTKFDKVTKTVSKRQHTVAKRQHTVTS